MDSESFAESVRILAPYATRYAMGRMTYAMSDVVMAAQKASKAFTMDDLVAMLRDVDRSIESGQTGDPRIDRPVVDAYRVWLVKEIESRRFDSIG